MKFLVALSAVFAVAVAKPGYLAVPVAAPLALPYAVSSQYHAQDELGQYSYGYADPLSSKSEVKTFDGVTRGGYSYVDADGKLQSVQYTSDAVNGFRVAASNLPVAPAVPAAPELEAPKPVEDTPEVAAAKAQHLEAVKEAEVQAEAQPEAPAAVVAAAPVVAAPVVTAYAAPAYTAAHYTAPAYHAAHYTAPAYTTYAAAPVAYGYPGFGYAAYSHYNHIAPYVSTYAAPYYNHVAPVLPEVPVDTPEVAKAKAEHLAAHEEVKARNV